MNLDNLKGTRFRYDSPLVGLSDWEDTVDGIIVGRQGFLKRGLKKKEIKSIGHRIVFMIKGKKTGQVYEFDRCVFLNKIEKDD